MQESGENSRTPTYGVWRNIRRVFILIVGVTVILIGVVLLVTPGPAMLVIPAGLAILATEFVWARRLLKRVKASAVSAAYAARGYKKPVASEPDAPQSFWQHCIMRVRDTYQASLAPFRKGYVDDLSDERRKSNVSAAQPHDGNSSVNSTS